VSADDRPADAVVGGLRPALGTAPFARGAAVLSDPRGLLRISGSAGEETSVSPAEWAAYLAAGQAHRLSRPAPAAPTAALWVLRETFTGRQEFLRAIADAGALVHREPAGGSVVTVVREDRGGRVRDAIADDYFDAAASACASQEWGRALPLVDLAFCLGRALDAECTALRVLVLTQVGRVVAARGLCEVAERSRGADFGEEVFQRFVALYERFSAGGRP
jgi:hypothetical protein